jgi:hypothetical protein
MGRLLDILATLACIAAGVYLLSIQSVAGNTVLEAIAHGIGIYFIGKGLFVARSTHLQAESVGYLETLTEFSTLQHERDTWEDTPEEIR